MNNLVSFVSEVEEAVASGDPVRRVAALRRMTNLFIEQAPHLKELHITVFDEVILRLARDIEFRARIELSDRLADIANAPRRVVRDLAFDDDIKVAGPILERSSRLDDADLVELARTRGQDHLFAMTKRPSLSETVTDVIVDRGDTRVVRSVAGNEGARFSVSGFSQLLERARQDEALQAVLKARADIPASQMRRLVEIAREKVRETMRAEFEVTEAVLVDETIDEVADLTAQGRASRTLTDDLTAAVAAVDRFAAEGGLNEDLIAQWLSDGRIEEAIAGIAQVGALPVLMVARAYHSTHYDPLLFIVRSLRFGWPTFKLILTCKAGRQPPAEVLKSAFEAYQHLSIPTAQKVVRFTAVRESGVKPAA